jgi:hypothetical protein
MLIGGRVSQGITKALMMSGNKAAPKTKTWQCDNGITEVACLMHTLLGELWHSVAATSPGGNMHCFAGSRACWSLLEQPPAAQCCQRHLTQVARNSQQPSNVHRCHHQSMLPHEPGSTLAERSCTPSETSPQCQSWQQVTVHPTCINRQQIA